MCIKFSRDQIIFIKPSLLTSMVIYSKSCTGGLYLWNLQHPYRGVTGMWGHSSPETKAQGQIPSTRHAMWPQKKADIYPGTQQISPYTGLLSLWPTAAQSGSSRLCIHAVLDLGTTPCSAKSSVPCPTTASWPCGWHRACLAIGGGLLSHRASTGRGQLRSFDSRSYVWALKGCLQGLFDLY